MDNCVGRKENFTGSATPQSAATHVTETEDILKLFSSKEETNMIIKETNIKKTMA
jgi:hypothetical protein